MKELTADEYIRLSIIEYPTLFVSDTYLKTRLCIFDKLFNVIGNGIHDNLGLYEHLHVEDNVIIPSHEHICKYIDGDVYYGYDGNVCIECLKDDIISYANVKAWHKLTKQNISLYPNFKKEYSLVYKCDSFFNYNSSWLCAAVEYYNFAKYWIENYGDNEYYGAYPGPNKDHQVKCFLDRFKTYSTYDEIYKSYGIEYNGDIDKFLIEKWIKEKNRILSFIDEILILLKN
jgi:hypothetical protein